MATKKLDLNKLRDEINKEKQNRNIMPSNLGESVSNSGSPRDEFLHGLISSISTGKPTPATNLIKGVENKVAEKKGEVKRHIVEDNQLIQQTQPARRTSSMPVDMSLDREEQLFRDLEAKRKMTLAESIEGFSHGNVNNNAPVVNYNGQQFLTSKPNIQKEVPEQLNEGVLVESVKNVVNNYLSENLGSVFEEAIKGTIIEMYAVERIKEVLNENRDLIAGVVKDVIREIQAKNKAKAH